MGRVFIKSIGESGIEPDDLRQAFTWLDWEKIIPKGATVFIKPNLTWPVHIPGVTTTPKAIESLVTVLKDRTSNILVGESDGGYHSFHAEEAFVGHKLYELSQEYGVSLINLSGIPHETVEGIICGKNTQVNLPSLLLHDIDLFISVPVPKTHVMTRVSLGFKNQWGCIPTTMRLREHYDFDRKIVLINKILNPKLIIMDGLYFLDGAGPMTGEAIKMNLLIAGNEVGSTSNVTCEIMGIKSTTIRHFNIAKREALFPRDISDVETNTSIKKYQSHQFKIKRALIDWISLIGFRSKFFTNIFYDSSSAGPLHSLLFMTRKNKIIEYLLYGKAGTPPSWIAGK